MFINVGLTTIKSIFICLDYNITNIRVLINVYSISE